MPKTPDSGNADCVSAPLLNKRRVLLITPLLLKVRKSLVNKSMVDERLKRVSKKISFNMSVMLFPHPNTSKYILIRHLAVSASLFP